MFGQTQKRVGVVLLESYANNWLRTIITALAQRGHLPPAVLTAKDPGVTMRRFQGDLVELIFTPVNHTMLIEVITYDQGGGYILVVALLPSLDGDPALCSAFVPSDGWAMAAEELPADRN